MFQRLTTFLIVAAMTVLGGVFGCSQATDSGMAKTGNANQELPVKSKPAEPPAVANSAVPPVSNDSRTVNGSKPNLTPSQPTPYKSSGGDDFSLFTQIRGRLNADKELSTAVIVDVKELVVTLKGNVSSQAQRSKAEQIVQSVKGIKALKNNLRVTS